MFGVFFGLIKTPGLFGGLKSFSGVIRELEIIFLKKISKKFFFVKSLLQQGFQQVIIE